MRRMTFLVTLVVGSVLMVGPALACGGLIAPNGTVNLIRTTTLAGYADGVEHYVTSFEFVGGGAKFGSIVPLPGVPSKVTKAGRWTLQRLVEETQPVVANLGTAEFALDASAPKAVVLLEKSIRALDITVLTGGGDAVGEWAKDEGFNLPPDAPEVLDFYASRSPVFMAVRFNAARAAELDQQKGEGTPIHLRIPTANPWVPLRILALGKLARERVEADVYLLNEREPALLPKPTGENGLVLERSEQANDLLLKDLRSDRGMKWIERDMWFTYLRVDADAEDLVYDLAIDQSGAGQPSERAAGFDVAANAPPPLIPSSADGIVWWPWLLAGAVAGLTLAASNRMLGAIR